MRRAAHRWKARIELFPNYGKYFLKLLLGSQKNEGKKSCFVFDFFKINIF